MPTHNFPIKEATSFNSFSSSISCCFCCMYVTAHVICRLLRSAKHHLEKDLTEKLGALGLDETCTSLSDRSEEIGYSQRGAKIQTK